MHVEGQIICLYFVDVILVWKLATILPYENNGMSGALNMVDGLVVEVNIRM